MTADHLNSPHNREKLLQHIQTPLSQKRKTFSQLFLHYWNLKKIFRILTKKTSFIAQIFWNLLTLENVVTCMRESSRFRTPFVNQRVHGSKTLTNFSWRHFYHNFTLLRKRIQLESMSLNQIWYLITAW